MSQMVVDSLRIKREFSLRNYKIKLIDTLKKCYKNVKFHNFI